MILELQVQSITSANYNLQLICLDFGSLQNQLMSSKIKDELKQTSPQLKLSRLCSKCLANVVSLALMVPFIVHIFTLSFFSH